MKLFLLALLFAALALPAKAQSHSSAVYVWKVYSENANYYLRSIPWDDETPSLRGTTSVYKKEGGEPIYTLPRGFDDAGDNLVLSNNGEVIFYAIPWMADETKDGLKSITIYVKGKISCSLTEHELTGCDDTKEHCGLLYSNFNDVVDGEQFKTTGRVVLKENVDSTERFLFKHTIIVINDTVYLIDPKKKVHKFDLVQGTYLGAVPLDSIYDKLRSIADSKKVESQRFESPTFLDFPKLRSGQDSYQALAASLGMKVYDNYSTKDEKYKKYGFKLNSYIRQDGSIEVVDIELFADLPKQKIIDFFASNKFVSRDVPSVFEKWYLDDQYFYFRNKNDVLARKEKRDQIIKDRENLKKLLASDTINGRYIPKDLGDAFAELDKLLPEIDRKEMFALKARSDMIGYHMGLGMWIRNNWGLWGGSRFQKYFVEKGIRHPDDMSSVVLYYYWDWLHGKKETWRDWEKTPDKAEP